MEMKVINQYSNREMIIKRNKEVQIIMIMYIIRNLVNRYLIISMTFLYAKVLKTIKHLLAFH